MTSLTSSQDTFELTMCAQQRRYTTETEIDKQFFWNHMLHTHLLRFGVDCAFWLLKTVCGTVEIRTIQDGSRRAKVALISRLSCGRACTQFNVRGTNDNDLTANLLETEQAIYLDLECTSYVQQFVVNLLGRSKDDEAMLPSEFQRHQVPVNAREVPQLVYGYHQNTSALPKLKAKLDTSCSYFDVFHANGDIVLRNQWDSLRANFLNCLDGTNCMQKFLGLKMISQQIQLLSFQNKNNIQPLLHKVFCQMWINNGSEVSKLFVGSADMQGGLKTSALIKAGMISIVKTDQVVWPISAGDSNVSAEAPNIPHRPAPPVSSPKAYQETEQKQNLSQKSISSSSSNPVQESKPQKQSPRQTQPLVVHDQDTGVIHEENNNDIVSKRYCK